MKPRRVIVTLELTTDIPLKDLRSADVWHDLMCQLHEDLGKDVEVEQVQVNVIKDKKK
jgi:hypothetical protein